MDKRFVYACLAFLLSAPLSRAAENQSIFKAGAAKLVMTPAVESGRQVWLAGYQGGRAATGVHDDLWVTALAMEQGKESVLLVTLDLIGYLFDEVAAVKEILHKELGLSPSKIFICSTHDHSGPDAIGLWGPPGKTGKDQLYLNHLRDKIVQCAREALGNRKPARLRFGKVHYGNPIEDSRPPIVINDLLLTMQVLDEQNHAIATLVNYALHAEVLNGRNTEITSDFPGILREELEKQYGGVGIFIPADIGGMQSPFVLFHSFWSRRRVGRSIADKAIESLKSAKPEEIGLFHADTRDILFPMENKRYIGAMEAGLFGQSNRFIKKEGDKYFLPAQIAFIQLGPAQFLTLPGEAFPELGNMFRAKMSPDYPFVLGLCNNEIGYIVPPEEWNPEGYEENMSLGRQTADILLKSISTLISKQ